MGRFTRRIASIRLLFLYAFVCLNGAAQEPAPTPATPNSSAPEVLSMIYHAPTGNTQRREQLAALFRETGASKNDIHEERILSLRPRQSNVWVKVEGTDPQGGSLIIGAHTDTYANSPGVIDNWSSCVMLAALYQNIRKHPLKCSVYFVGFGAEEYDQQGSKQFLRTFQNTHTQPIKAMINLECLGVSAPVIWANQSADSLEAHLLNVATSLEQPVSRQRLYGFLADSTTFRNAGIPAMTIHSLNAQGVSAINTTADTASLVDFPAYVEQYHLLSHFLRHLGQTDQHFAAIDLDTPTTPTPDSTTETARLGTQSSAPLRQ